jgi:glutaredoxin-like protein NrdH
MVKRFLDEHKISFVEHNIDTEPEFIDYLKDKGFQTVPVIETPDTIFNGFRPDQLRLIPQEY